LQLIALAVKTSIAELRNKEPISPYRLFMPTNSTASLLPFFGESAEGVLTDGLMIWEEATTSVPSPLTIKHIRS